MPTATANHRHQDPPTTTPDVPEPLWIGAHEAPERYGIPAGTIRSQASRGRLLARGKDNKGRNLYATADIRRINRIPDESGRADKAAHN